MQQLLKPTFPINCALQQEKPPQWEALTLQLRSPPCWPQTEKARTQQGRPSTVKNKQIFKKRGCNPSKMERATLSFSITWGSPHLVPFFKIWVFMQYPWEGKGEKTGVAFPPLPSKFPLNDVTTVTKKGIRHAGSLRQGLCWSFQCTCS